MSENKEMRGGMKAVLDRDLDFPGSRNPQPIFELVVILSVDIPI